MSHLKDHGADQRVDRPGEGFSDPGSLKTPQHYPPFAEDGEEI